MLSPSLGSLCHTRYPMAGFLFISPPRLNHMATRHYHLVCLMLNQYRMLGFHAVEESRCHLCVALCTWLLARHVLNGLPVSFLCAG